MNTQSYANTFCNTLLRYSGKKNNTNTYTFGHDAIASARLKKLAETFNPFSAEFIRSFAAKPVIAAIDLGCGPGYTTQNLAINVKAKEVYGFDASENFVAEAADRFKGCIFLRQDVSKTPFLIEPEVMYGRFLLSHFPEPIRLINTWLGELPDKGLLLLEEVENIETDIQAFNDYLHINRELVSAAGARLYVGNYLATGRYNEPVRYNETVRISIPNTRAAEIFYYNTISVWKKEAFVRDNYAKAYLAKISAEIARIAASNDTRLETTWVIRRLVLEKKEQERYYELFI